MTTIHRIAAATVLAAASTLAGAAPVFFSTSANALVGGSGYGNDGNGVGGDLLNVTFATIAGVHTATLSAGQSFTFDFGTITLNEAVIGLDERNNLGVAAQFSFTDPLAGLRTVTATGQAFFGLVNADADADYTIDWNDLAVDFGSGGSFLISLADMTFTSTGTQTQTATITLRTESTSVPEPSTMALAGLALLGAAGIGRRRR
jgi:hypothetical protein